MQNGLASGTASLVAGHNVGAALGVNPCEVTRGVAWACKAPPTKPGLASQLLTWTFGSVPSRRTSPRPSRGTQAYRT
jgi:hypothetical protein